MKPQDVCSVVPLPFSTRVLIPGPHFTDADAEELRGGLIDKTTQMWVLPRYPTRAQECSGMV